MDEVWITYAKAAEIFGSSPGKIQSLVHRGRIDHRPGHSNRPSLLLSSVLEAREQDRVGQVERQAKRSRRRARSGPPDDGHEWLPVSQVAGRLGVSTRRVHQLAAAGQLPFTTVGNRRWFRADHVQVAANVRRFTSKVRAAARAPGGG